jgi:hypothetical protein
MFGPDAYESLNGTTSVAHANETLALLVDVVAACQAEGSVTPDWSARDVALSAWSAIHGFAMLLISRRLDLAGFDVGRPADRVTLIQTMFGRGIGP